MYSTRAHPFLILPKALGVTAILLLSACNTDNGLDWDLRAGQGSLDTSEGARQPTAARPSADGRGIISYPGYQLALAQRGETVAAVAQRLGIDAETLARANALRPGDPLRDGEMLLLPTRVSGGAVSGNVIGGSTGGVDVSAIATTALDRADPATGGTPLAAGPEPIRHTVARGETAFSIARTYNVSARALADWNGLGADLAVREGQPLIIPPATGPAAAVFDSTAPGTGSQTPEPPSATEPLPDEETTPAAEAPKETPASPDLGETRTEATETRFAMPVNGKIIRAYQKNEGIDISAAPGATVKAAADGTVAAVTTDTGQVAVIVVRHADNVLTVYAGLDGVKVAKGDKVKRGQSLAVIRAGTPSFLRFEVRRGATSVDPLEFLQ